MGTYFARGNYFIPPKSDVNHLKLQELSGVLVHIDTRPGKSPSGQWIVIRINTRNDIINVFLDPKETTPDIFAIGHVLLGRTITLQCKEGVVSLLPSAELSEMSVRADLIKGVSLGNLKSEDLPALIEFSKGDDKQFKQWLLFKQHLENEGLAKVEKKLEDTNSELQEHIELERRKMKKLEEEYDVVIKEKQALLSELYTALMLLNGEERLNGFGCATVFGLDTEELVPIKNGYQGLVAALQKAGTREGLYVICKNTIHQIHHIFLENKGRAYLLGTEKEILKTKPEKVKEIIDRIKSIDLGDK